MKHTNIQTFITATLLSLIWHIITILVICQMPTWITKKMYPLSQRAKKEITVHLIDQPFVKNPQMPQIPTNLFGVQSTQAASQEKTPQNTNDKPLQKGGSDSPSLSNPPPTFTNTNPLMTPEHTQSDMVTIHPSIKSIDSLSEKQSKTKSVKTNDKQLNVESSPKQSPSIPMPKTIPSDPTRPPTTGEHNLTSTSEIMNEIRYNLQSTPVTQYLVPELRKIINLWNLQILKAATHIFPVKKTVIAFEIFPDGSIKNIKVIEHDGEETMLYYPLIAIEKAGKLSPLPQTVLDHIRQEGLWVYIEFKYTSHN